ncbi:MAG: magnesium protoporphyrin IX methyltransferase [Pseudanabaenaceae cyanobacterium]
MTDKQIVQEYFNNTGFDRWRKIYSDSDQVSRVQLDIREGHQRTIDQVLYWLKKLPDLQELEICDVGCGVGSLSVPLAKLGAKKVYASDISEKMIAEAKQRAGELENLCFSVNDLENLTGSYDVLACLDVIIHYPTDEALKMLTHLANLTKKRLIISFAPKNLYYDLLKGIGNLFPGASKTTRAYLHPEKVIKQHLQGLGFTVQQTEFIASQFYFARIYDFSKT